MFEPYKTMADKDQLEITIFYTFIFHTFSTNDSTQLFLLTLSNCSALRKNVLSLNWNFNLKILLEFVPGFSLFTLFDDLIEVRFQVESFCLKDGKNILFDIFAHNTKIKRYYSKKIKMSKYCSYISKFIQMNRNKYFNSHRKQNIGWKLSFNLFIKISFYCNTYCYIVRQNVSCE